MAFYNDQVIDTNKPKPQLSCVNDFLLCYDFSPEFVECFNKETNGYNIEWKCEADLSKNVNFKSTKVICDDFEDDYGSKTKEETCKLEYSLEPHSPSNYFYELDFL